MRIRVVEDLKGVCAQFWTQDWAGKGVENHDINLDAGEMRTAMKQQCIWCDIILCDRDLRVTP